MTTTAPASPSLTDEDIDWIIRHVKALHPYPNPTAGGWLAPSWEQPGVVYELHEVLVGGNVELRCSCPARGVCKHIRLFQRRYPDRHAAPARPENTEQARKESDQRWSHVLQRPAGDERQGERVA